MIKIDSTRKYLHIERQHGGDMYIYADQLARNGKVIKLKDIDEDSYVGTNDHFHYVIPLSDFIGVVK